MANPTRVLVILPNGQKSYIPLPDGASPEVIAAAVSSYLVAHPVTATPDNTKVDKVAGKGLTKNELTDELKTAYDGAVTHAGSAHAPSNATVGADWNTNVSNKPTIPANLSDLSADSTHQLTTDAEKTAWNGKQAALGFTPASIEAIINNCYPAGNTSLTAGYSAIYSQELEIASGTEYDILLNSKLEII